MMPASTEAAFAPRLNAARARRSRRTSTASAASQERSTTMTVAAAPLTRRVALAPAFAGCAAVALVVALRAPLATTPLGLIGFGVLHNVLELRYVAGRFAGVLSGRLLWLLAVLVTGI